MEVCIKPCAPVCEDVYFVCKRVLEHGNVFSGLQAVITQEIILLCIAIQLFQFLQHLAAHPAGRLTFLYFAQHIQVTPIQRTEAVQLFVFLGRCGVRHGVILFALATVLLLHLYLPDILHNISALCCDPRCELPGRVFIAQRFQTDKTLPIRMPDRNIFPPLIYPDLISAPAQHIPKFVYGTRLREDHVNVLTDHTAHCGPAFLFGFPLCIMFTGFYAGFFNYGQAVLFADLV